MTSNKRHIVLQTDFTTGLTRLDQHCNWTTTETTDKEEKRKSPRFAFLKISANAHLAHPAFPTHIANTTKSGKSQILRSEEHTSELQSRGHLVCRLLLEKKNHKKQN